MKRFYFFSRVMAVLFTAMMTMPLWAAYAPDVYSGYKAENYTEETIELSRTFKLGEQFNFQEVFPDLPTRFQYEGSLAPSPEGYNVIGFDVNVLGENSDLHNLNEVEITTGYCYSLGGGTGENSATLTLWHMDTIVVPNAQYPSIQEVLFTKLTTYVITFTVEDRLILPGTKNGSEPDPTVIQDRNLQINDNVDAVGFYYASDCSIEESTDWDAGKTVYSNFSVTWGDCGSADVESSNSSVVYVQPSGSLSAFENGTAVITYTVPAGDFYSQRTFQCTITVGDQSSQDEGLDMHFIVSREYDSQTYQYVNYTAMTSLTLESQYQGCSNCFGDYSIKLFAEDQSSMYPDQFYNIVDQITLTSSDPSVATVVFNSYTTSEQETYLYPDLVITPLSFGTTTITASFAGNSDYPAQSATLTITFAAYDDRSTLTLCFADNSWQGECMSSQTIHQYENYGQTYWETPYVYMNAVTGQYQNYFGPSYYTIESSNPSVATAKIGDDSWNDGDNEMVVFTIKGEGTTTFTARFIGSEYYKPATATFTLTCSTEAEEPAHAEDVVLYFGGVTGASSGAVTYTEDTYGKCSAINSGIYLWLRKQNGNTIENSDAFTFTVESLDESVVTIDESAYAGYNNIFLIKPHKYATATIRATFAGTAAYNATYADLQVTFVKNNDPFIESTFVIDATDCYDPMFDRIELTEGDEHILLPSAHPTKSAAADYPRAARQGRLETMGAKEVLLGNYWDESTHSYSNCRARRAGEDFYTFYYYKGSLIYDFSKAEDRAHMQYMSYSVPMYVEPLIKPVANDQNTSMTDPSNDENFSLSGTNQDKYNSSSHQTELNTIITYNLVTALDEHGAGSDKWKQLLPGTITFNVPKGKGTVLIQCQTRSGYMLKAKIRDHSGTFDIKQPELGVAQFSYDVDEITAVVLYLDYDNASPAPARQTAQATQDDAPNAIIQSMTVKPEYSVAANEDPDNTGYFYSTFYHGTKKYQLPNDGTVAYAAKIDANGDLVLTSIAEGDQILPAATAVILRSITSSFSLAPSESDNVVSVPNDNQLRGVDVATDAEDNTYVLSGRSTDGAVQGVGFYQFSGTIPAHKAYIIYSGNQAPKRMRFVFDNENTATGVDNTKTQEIATKLIKDGHLYIIKDNVYYNAQGQIVK